MNDGPIEHLAEILRQGVFNFRFKAMSLQFSGEVGSPDRGAAFSKRNIQIDFGMVLVHGQFDPRLKEVPSFKMTPNLLPRPNLSDSSGVSFLPGPQSVSPADLVFPQN